MDERREPQDPTPAVPALVEAQVETARAEVFRAYVRARAKARELAADHQRERPDGAAD